MLDQEGAEWARRIRASSTHLGRGWAEPVPELSEAATDALRAFVRHGIVVDPWLGGIGQEHIEFGAQSVIAEAVARIAGAHWDAAARAEVAGVEAVPWTLGRSAVHEVLAATAAGGAHRTFGRLRIGTDIAAKARDAVERFISAEGFAKLVVGHGILTFIDNHSAVEHYRGLSEDAFVMGLRHRPWAMEALASELLCGLAAGRYRIVLRDGARYVVNTSRGRRMFAEMREGLATSGYLKERLAMMHLSQFNLFEEWDLATRSFQPEIVSYRRRFTRFIGLPEGARCLECGCGSAAQMFEGGLLKAVGASGELVGIDSAPGMIARARARAESEGATNVTFHVAKAEALPFGDAGFDAAVGVAFLHWTDAPLALAEMHRVTRPGGTVAVCSPAPFPVDMRWLRDWFKPVFDVAQRYRAAVHIPAFEPGEVAELFRAAGMRDVRVRILNIPWHLPDAEAGTFAFVQGIGMFEAVMEPLPWGARQELIREVRARGQRVCATTPPHERVIRNSVVFVRGLA